MIYWGWSLILKQLNMQYRHDPDHTIGCLNSIKRLNASKKHSPDHKVHGAKMGPIWGQQVPGGPHVGPVNFAIWEGPDAISRHHLTGPIFNIKMVSYWYRNVHYRDQMVSRPFHLYNRNPYNDKMVSLYWISPQMFDLTLLTLVTISR